MNLKSFLRIFGVIAVVITLVPLIAADFWWIRVFDYLHIQLTLLTLTAIAAYFIRFNIRWQEDYIFMGVLLACLTYQVIKIFPYLPHDDYEVGEASSLEKNENHIKFYSANVLQKNKKPDLLIEEIKKQNPDVILFTETNKRWQRDLAEVVADYPYKIEVPLDNTYGMLVYSRLEMTNPEVKYLVDDSIPSIHTNLRLPTGEEILFLAIHPTPPMPQHNPSSSDRDAEMMMIAKKAMESKIPVVVAGDFNDVAWSSTTSLFQKIGGLLDTRAGRGFYNTFDATSFLMRWPLDHYYVTEEFRLVDLGLGSEIDSDHFPFLITLSLEPEKAADQIPQPPSSGQIEKANNQIKTALEKQAEKKAKGE